MNCNGENEMWGWQVQECGLEDNTSIDLSKCLPEEDSHSCMYGESTTPVKACGDLAYNVPGDDSMEKEIDQCREPSSQAKRRRMLQFESEDMGQPLFSDMFLRSKETPDSLEDVLSEMSQWVAGFSEGTSGSTNDYLDPSPDSWIADCLNDTEMHLGTDNISNAPGESDVQIDIEDLWNSPLECNANAAESQLIQTPRNIVIKGTKSLIHTAPKLASAVISPFTFIKPCGMLGDTTLKDINQRIQAPPKSKHEDPDTCETYPTSAFSGKPVVGKTKIRTEGGEGSITIVRTKG